MIRISETRIGYLFALSRTPHAVLDLAAPALTALLWTGRIPGVQTILLGLVTAFAAYTAVYALNDLVDYNRDRRRIAAGCPDPDGDLDASLTLHPIALGCLPLRAALIWTAVWSVIAFIGAYILNPACAFVFLLASAFETLYCVLGDVTPARTLIAGMVKSAGPLAAILAVDPTPDVGRFLIFFAWLFLWEVGGQNIPNDWADVHEDRRAGLRTVPVAVSARRVSVLMVVALVSAVVLSTRLVAPLRPSAPVWMHTTLQTSYLIAVLAAGALLLLLPAARLVPNAWKGSGGYASAEDPTGILAWSRSPLRKSILSLFNRASYYPLGLLTITGVRILIVVLFT